MKKRILFLPNDLGGGRGHVSRMLYLAQLSQEAGIEAAVVLGAKYAPAAQKAKVRVFRMDNNREQLHKWRRQTPHWAFHKMVTRIQAPPAFVYFSGLAYQVPRDGYLSEGIVRFRLKQLERICTRFKPDLIVGDTHLLTRILARRCSLPVIQVTRKAGFPPQPEFLWWVKQPFPLIEPKGMKPFIAEFIKNGLPGPEHIEDLLAGDAYLIPSLPEIEPVPEGTSIVLYTGPLHHPLPDKEEITFPGRSADPAIYITIGGGATRGGLKEFFTSLIHAFKNQPFRVLVSTAGKIQARHFNGSAANIRFENWVNGTAAITKSDLIIHHGGYSTSMETILSGKPAVVIPGHSEQEGNGRRLEQLGTGKVLLPYSAGFVPLEFEWTYGRYTAGAVIQPLFEPEEIRGTVQKLLAGSAQEKANVLRQAVVNKQKEFHIQNLWALLP